MTCLCKKGLKKQISYLKGHPKYEIIGGQISEFIDEESNCNRYALSPM